MENRKRPLFTERAYEFAVDVRNFLVYKMDQATDSGDQRIYRFASRMLGELEREFRVLDCEPEEMSES